MPTIEAMKATYDKHLHLKNAATELGMKWQTLYYHLKKENHPVVGNKKAYGSATDKVASLGEELFKEIAPQAKDMNETQFQSKYDFEVTGWKVDIKTSNIQEKQGKYGRWAFSIKKQEAVADMFVCFAFKNKQLAHCFLIPGELARMRTTISLSGRGVGRWWDFEVTKEELADFFQPQR